MTESHRYSIPLLLTPAMLLLASTGCAPQRNREFQLAFVPPAPGAVETSAPAIKLNEPVINSDYFIHEAPNLVPAAGAPRIPITDELIRDADARFDAGKRAYQEGRLDEARREFNRAVDILLTAPDTAPERARLERRLEQMIDTIYRYDVNGLGAGEDADEVVYDKPPFDDIIELTFPIDPRLKPKVKEEIAATASQLPLEENDAVVSYIHFFSTPRGRRILTDGLERAGRYRPLIERILAEEGVPQELMYLAQIESGFLPRAVSSKRAAGMWQFMRFRAREYGLEQTRTTDERLDPEKATRAAARHLRDLYNQFGDWYLALAAYNCGPGCVSRAVERTGYADFWKLRDLDALPKETQNYVPAILAATIMAKNPKDYGLEDVEAEPPLEYDTVKLDATTSLALIADAIERPVSEIRALNPALLRSSAPKGFELHVPKGSAATLAVALANIPLERRASVRIHRVERGETLSDIAHRYHSAAAAIAEANELVEAPQEGDVLIIPAAYSESQAGGKHKGGSKSSAPRRNTSSSKRRSTASNAQQHVSSAMLARAGGSGHGQVGAPQ